jgi:hypothetical protein
MQHHAYLYEGPLSVLPQLADNACERFDFKRGGNPDVLVRQWEKFGIDEARELTQQASLKSTSGRSLFVLGISSITSEAQQALLKLFEEPNQGAVFVVLIPHGTVLPTLRSRFLPYPETLKTKAETGDAKEFLSSPYAKRSAWVTAFLKNDDEDTREQTRTFVNGLESILYEALQKTKDGAKGELLAGLADISHFRQYLGDRAPSLKMILEHFAATLPKI